MTVRIVAEQGFLSLELEVSEDADLDGEFEAVECATGDKVRLCGWLWDIVRLEDAAVSQV